MSKREVEEMRALVLRVARGSVSREDWSNLAALTVLSQGDETIAAIAADGLDAFIHIAQPIYDGHAFQHDDYRRMYDRICAAASRYVPEPVH